MISLTRRRRVQAVLSTNWNEGKTARLRRLTLLADVLTSGSCVVSVTVSSLDTTSPFHRRRVLRSVTEVPSFRWGMLILAGLPHISTEKTSGTPSRAGRWHRTCRSGG